MVRAIVTKTGNSYALRVPKRYIEDNHLKLGDTVELEEPIARQRKALKAMMRLNDQDGGIASIPDPTSWQREQRLASNPWDEVKRDDPSRQ